MNSENQNQYEKYERAKKQVLKIKGFYNHLKIFIFINLLVLIAFVIVYYNLDIGSHGKDFANWLYWNVVFSPSLWLIGLIIHGLIVFQYKLPFVKKWEEKQIEEIMNQEEQELRKHHNNNG